MEFKWLNTMYQYEAEPGGGGGDAPVITPAAAEGDGLTPQPGADPPAEGTPPPPPPEPAVEEPVVGVPESTKGMFRQPEPAPARREPGPPNDGYPHKPPPTAPPKVDPPTQDEWELEPGKAAQKMQAYYDWKIHNETTPLRDTIDQQDRDRQSQDQANFAQKSAEVRHAATACETAVDGFYAKGSVLQRDADFRNNPGIQKHVEDTINACVERALDVADRTGDSSRLNDIANNPKFLKRVLHMAKGEAQFTEPSLRPGATPQGPAGATAPASDGLTQEDRDAIAAAKADGVVYTPEQIKAARAMRGE